MSSQTILTKINENDKQINSIISDNSFLNNKINNQTMAIQAFRQYIQEYSDELEQRLMKLVSIFDFKDTAVLSARLTEKSDQEFGITKINSLKAVCEDIIKQMENETNGHSITLKSNNQMLNSLESKRTQLRSQYKNALSAEKE